MKFLKKKKKKNLKLVFLKINMQEQLNFTAIKFQIGLLP